MRTLGAIGLLLALALASSSCASQTHTTSTCGFNATTLAERELQRLDILIRDIDHMNQEGRRFVRRMNRIITRINGDLAKTEPRVTPLPAHLLYVCPYGGVLVQDLLGQDVPICNGGIDWCLVLHICICLLLLVGPIMTETEHVLL